MIKIVQRQLNKFEALILEKEISNFPDIIFIDKYTWEKFSNVFVVEVDKIFAGCCAISSRNNWVKIGPMVILSKFQRKGLGNLLVEEIVKQHDTENLFCTSSNISVHKILLKNNFSKIDFFHLDSNIKLLLVAEIIKYMNTKIFSELWRKYLKFGRRSKRNYFVKYATD